MGAGGVLENGSAGELTIFRLLGQVEPVVSGGAADFDDRHGNGMPPVWAARKGGAVVERLPHGLGVRLGAAEDLALRRRLVCEILELDELRRLADARLGNREEVAASL